MTTTKDLALTKGHVPKVLAGGTALETFEAFQLTVVDKGPLLHAIRASTPVLVEVRRVWQAVCSVQFVGEQVQLVTRL